MWAKVLAGVLAAVSVAGVGVYVAMPSGGHCNGTCPLSGQPNVEAACPVSSGCVDLVSLPTCNGPPAMNDEAMAACAGGMVISAKANKGAVGHCCAE